MYLPLTTNRDNGEIVTQFHNFSLAGCTMLPVATHMVTGNIVKPHFSLAGCTMLPVTTHTVAYPAGVLTNEQYSAPVVPNSELYVSTSVCMSVFENNGLLLQ